MGATKTQLTDLEIAKKLLQIEQSATSRKIKFNLSFAETKRLLKSTRCYFTNAKFSDKVVKSFDRLDNKKGYEDGNVVACSQSFNSKKGNLTVTEIEQMYEGLKKKGLIKVE